MAKDGVRDRVRSARKRVVAAAAKAGDAEDDNVPSGRDGKDMVRESVRSATMAPPVKNSLETMDGRSRVVEMAKSGMAHPEPDWQDNPDDLDSPQEVRMSLLAADLNPVDADTKQDEEQVKRRSDTDRSGGGHLDAPDSDTTTGSPSDDSTTTMSPSPSSDDTSGELDAPESTGATSPTQDDAGSGETTPGTPETGGVQDAPEMQNDFGNEPAAGTPDVGGIANAPGSRDVSTEPTQGTVSAAPSERSTGGPQPEDFDSATAFVEAATERQFQSVDDSEIYATTENGRAVPRFTKQGAKQALATAIGVPVSDIELGPTPTGGFTVGDIRSELQDQQDALRQFEPERRNLLADTRESARVEAGQELRRRQQAQREAFVRGNLGDPEEILADKLSDQFGFEVTKSDIQGVGLEDGRVTYNLAPGVATAAAFQAQANRPGTPGDVQVRRTDSGDFDVDVSSEFGSDRQLEQELDEQLDQSVETARPSDQPRNQEVADFDWSFGLGGPGDEVESTIDDAADTVQSAGQTLGNEIFKPSGVGGQSAGEEVLSAAGYPELGETYESSVRSLGKGVVSGGTAIVNVPGIVGGTMEAVEAGGFAATRTAQGRGDEVIDEAGKFATAVQQQAADQPWKTAGLLTGSLAASTGVFRAARNVGPRTSTAARWTIQPGEEAAGSVGYRLTSAASGPAKAQRYFPNKEPLIFSEEAAIRGAKGVARRARSVRESVRGGQFEFQGSPRQRELIARFRPGTATETTLEEGAPGAVSEPLGSNTEGVLDATVGTPRRAETTGKEPTADVRAETSVEDAESQGVTEEMEMLAGQAQGRGELAAAIDEFGVSVREFAADDRAQTNLAGIGRGRTETETESELGDDRVSDNLYQRAVEQQVRADYRNLEGGSGRPSGQPFEARAGQSEVEAERGEAERLTERAQQPRVESETDSELDRRIETQLDAAQEQSAGTTPQFVQREGVIPRSNAGLALGLAVGSEFDTESLLGVDTEVTAATGLLDAQREQPPEQRQRRERRDNRLELEVETETEQETESRLESEPFSRDDENQESRRGFGGRRGGRSNSGQNMLSAGWVNEFVTDFALGPGITEAPSQQTLAGLDGKDPVEQRPTAAMVSGTEAEQKQIQEAEAFLFFSDDENDGGGGIL